MLRAVQWRGWVCVWLAGLMVLAGCNRTERLNAQAKDAWSAVISAHTSGVVSRKSEVRVLFASDVVPETGADAKAVLSIDPAVPGELQFKGARELVLTPTKDLESGRQYTVTVSPKGLKGVPQDIQPYQFAFKVQTPQFDVALQSLESDPADDQRMNLRGTLSTSDAEDAAKIEQLIAVSYLDTAHTPVWTHSSDGLTHTFVISGLQRQKEGKPVTVKLDGKPIGSTHTGELQMQVPAIGAFIVTDALAREEEGSKQIRIYFSDSLNDKQNLRGLVALSAGEFTTSIDSNMLVLYPKGELSGEVTVTLEAGIANQRGDKMQDKVVRTLTFTSEKPQVRFVGSGVILPEGKVLSVPFEAVSARSVRVTATRIYDDNMAQFLQVNKLGSNYEIGRVGRYMWRKTVTLTGPMTGRWTRYSLDVSELLQKNPGGMFQLSLQLSPADSAYQCAAAGEGGTAAPVEPELRNQEDGDTGMPSAWDYADDYFGVDDEGEDYNARWNDRNDPCKAAYFTFNQNVRAQRNVLASNIGLIVKSDQRGKLLATVTDLRTAQVKSGATLSVRNYQNQVIATATSDSNGLATIEPKGTPFLLVAESGGQKGYLKLNNGNALPVSHFDVGGETISKGLKGMIYGERGVWRPGDDIHLTFVVQDKDKTLPENHPATLELSDPRGRLVQTVVNAKPVGGFYRFDVKTTADAPTGDWSAKVTLGGVSFSKQVKVETVMPNRLKITLDFGKDILSADKPLSGSVNSQWLSGATAAGLKADVKLRLVPTPTKFNRFTDYSFDDPAREFAPEPEDVFEGTLDTKGNADFKKEIALATKPPGMLSATFTTRVFERGGAFSINREATTYAPFKRFVGIRLPKGDVARGMLQTDQDHVVELASVNASGAPTAAKLKVTLYKVDWRWWWDKTGDSLAQYVQSRANAVVSEEEVSMGANGQGQWKLRVNYPQWGRYLIRACDMQGEHCTGSTFYIDWPSWAGRQREQSGPAATMLSVTADKAKYQVGETATIQLPESAQGRALVTIENGSGILDARWIEPKPGNTRFTVPVTASMAPNVYVSVTLVQPHEDKKNDLPIRLYGVIPLEVTDPQTHITPVIQAANEWQPESKPTVTVSEAKGHAMTYTLAVVDEGLLSLTNFKTPDLYQQFFKREALGVKTWDLFDDVVGAYGAELERLLALGGSDGTKNDAEDQSRSRFPPVVQVLGPFQLKAGATAKHEITLPRYIGAVRVMVVAGDSSTATMAYGSADKSIYVRQPLMILPTMPRVVGPNEDIAVPVSIFVADAAIKNVALTIQPDSLFATVGDATTQVSFTQIEEKLGVLRLKAANKLGRSRVKFTAVSGKYRAESEINIEVRSSNPPTTRSQSKVIQPGESWSTTVVPHGIEGTNKVTLEVSAVPSLNIESRLRYLIQYPHGCLEQTTSSVFPQLFLGSLVKLEDGRKREIEDNIRAGIERLRSFQLANGGFSYWPGASGGFANGSLEGYTLWATTYASHFLVEAEKAGYTIPTAMRGGMIRYLKSVAQNWSGSATSTANLGSSLDQAYRLYVLARAGQPELGAMNRLREVNGLQATERWILAAAYQLAGLRDVAKAVAPKDPLAARDYKNGRDYTFGSELRDHAMVLQSLTILGQLDKSQDVVKAISDQLSSDSWYSTQSVAYSLMAMAQLTGASNNGPFNFVRTVAGKAQNVTATSPVYQTELTQVPMAGQAVVLRNTSQQLLFATVAVRGIPAADTDDAESAGLALSVSYTDADGNNVDVSRLQQGTDVTAHIEVKNATALTIDNIALTQIVPAGWEIQNDRMEGTAATGERDQKTKNPYDGSREATRPKVDYVDIRDDRVLQYFSLKAGETIRFNTKVNAAYRGRYYLPSILAEAMYDAGKHARTKGMWTEVVTQ
ncbi:MAG: MG2 domain-containing protein [Steroidobacteraceae bacterium]